MTAQNLSTRIGIGVPLPHTHNTGCVYLDYNATTPVFPEVAEAMLPYLLQNFGNPSSSHVYGQETKAAVNTARQQVADLVNAQPSEIYFTSCGTEADNWAIYGAVTAAAAQLPAGSTVPHVVSTAIEHPAVLVFLEHSKQQGLLDYTLVGVDEEGLVAPEAVEAALRQETVLVSVMHSNNEVGSLQPVREVAAIARSRGILMHSDAAQSISKVTVDVQELGVDLLTVVGHKFGAPKGVAALYIRQGVKIGNFLHGGGQEGGRRAGTENVLLLAGLGAAAELARTEAEALQAHMEALRDRLQAGLLAALRQEAVRVNGPQDAAKKLPNTLSISIRGVSASTLLQKLSAELAASAGAACHSDGGPAVSAVLEAMKVPVEWAVGTLRLSVGRHTREEDVDQAVELIVKAAQEQLQAA